MDRKEITPQTIKRTIVVIVIAIVAIFLFFSIQKILHKNPYGPQIKIDNFDEYYKDAPDYNRDITFNLLYASVLKSGLSEDNIPHSGAIIRSDSSTLDFIQAGKYYKGSFIVDIPDIQQSYKIQLSWAVGKDNDIIASNYPSYISCIDTEEMIYPDFGCPSFLDEEETEEEEFYTKYPLATKLPIRIEYYKDGHGEYIKYNIFTKIENTEKGETFSVLIEDYTGGNYNAALDRIRNLGFNPDDYKIDYKDLSEEYATPGYAGDD